jgi:hypothetical protein
MKKILTLLIVFVGLSIMVSSCYSHTFIIGEGAKSGVTVQKKNNFFLFGLIPGNVSDPQKMANGAKDYQITEVQSFVDGLLAVITCGIYTPTTTIVQK